MRRVLFLFLLSFLFSCDATPPGPSGSDTAADLVVDVSVDETLPVDIAVDLLMVDHRPCPDEAVTPSYDGVPLDDPGISGWAVAVVSYEAGEDVDDEWTDIEKAVGPAAGSSTEILCLGNGGVVTLSFEPAISDQSGPDLAVFENAIMGTFLELAFVEVSTDGVVFERFDSESLTPDPVGPFGAMDPTLIHGLAGTFMQGLGTPFDLAVLANHPQVLSGAVSLDAIRFVRIVDVVGDGDTPDSFGNPIYDPYPTTGSAGFDLDGVAVLGD